MKSKAINKIIIMIKEETIENSVKTLLSDILEYDNVVNDMYEDNVLAEDDIEELDLSKEKDDFER